MRNNYAALQYKSTDLLKRPDPQDAKSILVKCFDELLNSIGVFQENLVPSPDNFRKKSSSFSRALTIIYTLQSSIDFEKDLLTAKNLFQIYEYTRVALINEFKACKLGKSPVAVNALKEIRDTWKVIEY
jgi:flagellar protein FliS